VIVTVFQIAHEYLCGSCNDTVVHVSAQGSNDTIHYVYSKRGIPSVLIARTDGSNKLKINCSRFYGADTTVQSGSVRFLHPPDAAMVLIFTRVCWL